jgi:hypothetical protein
MSELDELVERLSILGFGACKDATDMLLSQSAEIERLRGDARRYQYLVGKMFEESLHFRGFGNVIQLCTIDSTVIASGGGADAAIDAALAETEQKEDFSGFSEALELTRKAVEP